MARVPPQALFLFGAVIVVLSLESGGVVVEVNGYTIEPGADLTGADLYAANLTGADLERAGQNPCQNGLVLQGHFGGFRRVRARGGASSLTSTPPPPPVPEEDP